MDESFTDEGSRDVYRSSSSERAKLTYGLDNAMRALAKFDEDAAISTPLNHAKCWWSSMFVLVRSVMLARRGRPVDTSCDTTAGGRSGFLMKTPQAFSPQRQPDGYVERIPEVSPIYHPSDVLSCAQNVAHLWDHFGGWYLILSRTTMDDL